MKTRVFEAKYQKHNHLKFSSNKAVKPCVTKSPKFGFEQSGAILNKPYAKGTNLERNYKYRIFKFN